jgi:aryl-alcohol dehydrogenase-like predicted oxidoreductase
MEARTQAAGTAMIGGDLPVHRLGFGAMRITGPDIWGPPRDPAEARRVLRRAVELGVNFHTADSYGPARARSRSRGAASHPPGLVIATRAGSRGKPAR